MPGPADGGETIPADGAYPVNLYLIRHGQTDLNRDRRFRGLSDAPLNAEGRAEAEAAASMLVGTRIPVIYTSPVERALETARIIAATTRSAVEVSDGFTDIDYGGWQGLTVEEVQRRYGEGSIGSWKSDPGGFTFPEGDSMCDVRRRLEAALVSVAGSGPENVAVVSHLAVLKVCFVVAMGLPFESFWKVNIREGSVSVFSWRQDAGFILEKWNMAATRNG